jgi:cysteine synthase A
MQTGFSNSNKRRQRMIDLSINKTGLEHNIRKAKENNIIIPTIKEMQNPELIPGKIKDKLKNVGLWDINPLNLFRITWKNEPKEKGGLYQAVPNYIEFPPELTGVPCRIIAMAGKWFPTGCHKVGASFGCLAPELVTGKFDATYHKAVWPSTGNYCRGGAFNSKLLSCYSIAILPAGMSRERFDWLKTVASEIIATPGTESNVKEIFDKTNELKADPVNMIFNQFEEMGNCLWHYNVTGYALADTFEAIRRPGDRFAGACFTSGSAGTMSTGDYLKEKYPALKLAVGEALQCPTILDNGFGSHRIEGIGDKHIPWIHNVKNTDMVIDIDDEDSQRLLRLFNTKDGQAYLKNELKLSDELIEKLTWLGISGIANVLCCIKMAKYYELTEHDVVGTVLTDSAVMYQSRIDELNQEYGAYNGTEARLDHSRHILDLKTDNMMELNYLERKRVHNLKYYTWVEQQGKTSEELNALWYDTEHTWDAVHREAKDLDELIDSFNEATGLLKAL